MFAPTWRKAEENGLARHDRAQRALSAAARDRKLKITRAGRFFHLTGGSDKGVPILRVARLAVDLTARGQGLGSALLRFPIELAERMMADFGCVGLVVDAKSESEASTDATASCPSTRSKARPHSGRSRRPCSWPSARFHRSADARSSRQTARQRANRMRATTGKWSDG